MSVTSTSTSSTSTFTIGGDLTVNRIGLGTMQLTGDGVWGEPRDRKGAVALLRRSVELGVNFFDTADCYGPYVVEELIREALHPYPADLVISTKGGVVRGGPDDAYPWPTVGKPVYLRQAVEMSLRRLALDQIDLYQLHRIDPTIPVEDSLGELAKLQQEGKIRHIAMSEVTVEELRLAQSVVPIAAVENLYNIGNRASETVLDHAQAEGMAFLPWFPLNTGGLAAPGGVLDAAATRREVTPAQLALAWLLHRAPNVLPIPGTRSIAHLEENVAAGAISLTSEEMAALSALAQ